ncbi:MAG: cyclic nucleotide-binding domain-containing protein [Limisphaerales bacterium]
MITHNLEPIIRQHPFFHGLEERHMELIVGCAKNVRFEQSQSVFNAGGPADQFYLIREGLVAVQVLVPQRGPVTVQTVEAGDVLGWSWLFPPYRWPFDARAVHATRALSFDGKCLRGKCEEDHSLGYDLFKRFTRVVTEQLEATRLQLLDLYGVNA